MEADECYLRYENGKIVRGCSWDNVDNLTKKAIRKMFSSGRRK